MSSSGIDGGGLGPYHKVVPRELKRERDNDVYVSDEGSDKESDGSTEDQRHKTQIKLDRNQTSNVKSSHNDNNSNTARNLYTIPGVCDEYIMKHPLLSSTCQYSSIHTRTEDEHKSPRHCSMGPSTHARDEAIANICNTHMLPSLPPIITTDEAAAELRKVIEEYIRRRVLIHMRERMRRAAV
eukprot:Tbor_TRINITY_DN9156_c0_g1::TRINITY_DN9156_c0_g1_i1::g.14493::m.14493